MASPAIPTEHEHRARNEPPAGSADVFARHFFYLWRPALKDPDDDFVLELAVKAGADIVTWNEGDFKRAAQFGVKAVNPRKFLEQLEKTP